MGGEVTSQPLIFYIWRKDLKKRVDLEFDNILIYLKRQWRHDVEEKKSRAADPKQILCKGSNKS